MFGMFGSSKDEWEYRELESPQNKKEYQKVGRSALRDRRELLDSDGWEIVSEASDPDSINIEKKIGDDSGVAMVRVTGYAKIDDERTIKDLAHSLFDPSEKLQKKMYDSVDSYEKTHTISDNLLIGHTIAKVSGISNREFVALRTIEENSDGSYLVVVQSINHPDYLHTSSAVRGTFRNGIELTPVTDSIVQIRAVEHVNPKGWVPGFIINSFIADAGSWIHRL